MVKRMGMPCVGGALVAMCAAGGCAVHYYDAKTGTEHIWGLGHLAVKVGPKQEGVKAVVIGSDVLGAAVGSTPAEGYLTLGWHRTQMLQVVDADAKVRLEWPTSDLFDVRVGTRPPASLVGGDGQERHAAVPGVREVQP